MNEWPSSKANEQEYKKKASQTLKATTAGPLTPASLVTWQHFL
jgi:hypothetical protein